MSASRDQLPETCQSAIGPQAAIRSGAAEWQEFEPIADWQVSGKASRLAAVAS